MRKTKLFPVSLVFSHCALYLCTSNRQTEMKRICAMTMVRNDEFFLRRWVDYYGHQLGREHLYVFLDGLDQTLTGDYEGMNVQAVPHIEGNVHEADRGRINFLSAQADHLFQHYDLVIGTDVDEFLLVDPVLGRTLPDYLSSLSVRTSVSALGLDVGQHLHREDPIRDSIPLLAQRRYAVLSDRYSKCSVLARPVNWGSGFHRVRGHGYHIMPDLYLFHFGCSDQTRLVALYAHSERQTKGWQQHLERRLRTTQLVTDKAPRSWDTTIARARHIENVFHQPYAWNKPTLLRRKWVVEIPERFRQLV